MGIDIYMAWNKQTEEEKQAQYTGYSGEHGHVGYLREAYHGNPYATKYLVQEAFENEGGETFIDVKKLRERLPKTLKLHVQREKDVYGEAVKETDPSAVELPTTPSSSLPLPIA